MSPTILVAGATGNTGRSVVETLSQLLDTKTALSNPTIVAITRSANGDAAQQLAKLPHVQVIELSWVDVTADWLREHNVVRVFIAPHLHISQFAQESAFNVAALNAGVKYVVRISTSAVNMRPDSPVYYARAHWAIEAQLSSPEFESLQWTSLQPNGFSNFWFASSAAFVKHFRETGEQQPLKLMASKDAPIGIIDPYEIGVIAAHLLAHDDPSVHNKARYVLNGREDITGQQIVDMVEEYIGAKVDEVHYKEMTHVEHMAAAESPEYRSLMLSIKHALDLAWEGKSSASTTSKEIIQLGLLKRTPAETFKALLE
ncbi:hypothetical protein NM208_g9186 [Fusarium decemcellulare]|uniref:Uncharacterized protein n=1 Tax=Fusarium decemcellulare TaxID=57161 RepID=A0ACC1S2I3_9HYPO|nr:hypothetical protein NM208_g9186 [Fusarium decemcellulare]